MKWILSSSSRAVWLHVLLHFMVQETRLKVAMGSAYNPFGIEASALFKDAALFGSRMIDMIGRSQNSRPIP